MRKIFATTVAILSLSACGPAPSEPATSGNQEIQFNELASGTMKLYTFTFSTPADVEKLKQAAKKQCGAADSCKVMGWTDKSKVAAAFPMTDPEAEAMAFNFTLNRSSGMEEAIVSCEVFPGTNPDQCF